MKKKISDDDFRDYVEYHKFMQKPLGVADDNDEDEEGLLTEDDLDLVMAARGVNDFDSFLEKIEKKAERK